MSVPRGNSVGSRPIPGSVPRRRTVLHRPLPASQGPRIGLQRHGRFLCQLLPKMWHGMITALHTQTFPCLFPSCRPFLHVQHQVYEPSTDPQVCCGSCKNISCTFTDENRTTDLFAVWVTHPRALCSTFFPLSGTDSVCLCRRGVPGWRTVHVTTVWKLLWER